MQSYNKILIIQTAFIGDVILATPIIETLHLNFPKAKIHFCLRKGNEKLFDQHPLLDKVLIWQKQENKWGNWWKLLVDIRKEKYDVVLCVQRFFSAGLLTALSGGKLKVGFNKNPMSFSFGEKVTHEIGNGLHETDRNLSLVKSFCQQLKTKPKLYISHETKEKIKLFDGENYITIAPASVWFTKQFPTQQWVNFLKKIPKLKVYLLGAPADQALAQKIIQESGHANSESLCGKLNFLESAALMKKAKMNFVNDSAPMHLASAVDAPVTAIFCSTIPEFGFGPLSTNSNLIQIKEKLSCRPCGLHGKKACPQQHFSCAYHININELTQCIPQ